jgi:hypothetical protein
MNIITNDNLVRRNSAIGRYTSIAGLLVLAVGMYLSFQEPGQFGLSLAALLVGFSLSQIGIYFGNRWSRNPRPDEQLNTALKGLNREYSIYHYQSPASHLLVGPAGVWVLVPRHQRGNITYRKGRYRQSGGGLRLFYMKIFAQEGLGRPDLDIQVEAERVEKYLLKEFEEGEMPPVQAALIFTNEEAQLDADEAPFPTLPLRKLKDFIRKQAKEKRLSPVKAQDVQALLNGA